MTLRRSTPLAGGDAAALRAWADRIAGRARGLLEPLKVIEVDAERDEAILRSDTPAAQGEDRFYYEVHLKGTRAGRRPPLPRLAGRHRPAASRSPSR